MLFKLWLLFFRIKKLNFNFFSLKTLVQTCENKNTCRNGATCSNLNGVGIKCTCASQWLGENCDQSKYFIYEKIELKWYFAMLLVRSCMNANTCLNGAACSNIAEGGITCTCVNGFTGNNCETAPLVTGKI